jgi:hypothetical protein
MDTEPEAFSGTGFQGREARGRVRPQRRAKISLPAAPFPVRKPGKIFSQGGRQLIKSDLILNICRYILI